jgi:acyl carrier protein
MWRGLTAIHGQGASRLIAPALGALCASYTKLRHRLPDDADLVDDLGGDSLDRVEIVMDIEDQFEREFPEDQVERLKTVGDVVALI